MNLVPATAQISWAYHAFLLKFYVFFSGTSQLHRIQRRFLIVCHSYQWSSPAINSARVHVHDVKWTYTGRWLKHGSEQLVQLHCQPHTGTHQPHSETRSQNAALHRHPSTSTSGTTAQSAMDFRSRDTPVWRHRPRPQWRQHTTGLLRSLEELNSSSESAAVMWCFDFTAAFNL